MTSKLSKERIRLAIDYYRYLLPFAFQNRYKNNLNNGSIISVFSAPRGGSTWLAEILGQIPLSSLVWEPLFRHPQVKYKRINPFSYDLPKKMGIWWNQYVPEHENWPELEYFFDKLFNREIVNLKLYRYTNLKDVSSSRYFIYKFCFGNLLLPWLTQRYKIKPIFLVRHPCAVVASQLKHGGFEYMRKNPQINVPTWARFHEYYLPYSDLMKSIKDAECSLAIRWALTHAYLLNHPKNNIDWLTVSYESLLVNTNYELDRIKRWIGIEFEFNVKQTQKSSFTSHKSLIVAEDQISNWKNSLSLTKVKTVIDLVNRIGIKAYSDEIMPDMKILLNSDA